MKFRFSQHSQRFFLKLLFVVMALSGLLGVWDGRFLAFVYPFSIQFWADALFALSASLTAFSLPRLLNSHPRFLDGISVVLVFYLIATSVMNVYSYTKVLGLEVAAERADLSPALYLFSEATQTVFVPLCLLFALLYFAHSLQNSDKS